VTQVSHLFSQKFVLLRVQFQVAPPAAIGTPPHIVELLLKRAANDNDVIQLYYVGLVCQTQDGLHQSLECGRSVTNSEGHTRITTAPPPWRMPLSSYLPDAVLPASSRFSGLLWKTTGLQPAYPGCRQS
jgi:hypothetical protein